MTANVGLPTTSSDPVDIYHLTEEVVPEEEIAYTEAELDDFLAFVESYDYGSHRLSESAPAPFFEVENLSYDRILGDNGARERIDYYNTLSWDRSESVYTDIILDAESIATNIKRCLPYIEESNPREVDHGINHGWVEARKVVTSTKIFVCSDLHGDLRCLLGNLKKLSEEGFLDENYRCSEGFYLIFTGDHVDRGSYGLQVLELLAFLKAENPHNVHLLRGNHEDTDSNSYYGDLNFQDFLEVEESRVSKHPDPEKPGKTRYMLLEDKVSLGMDYTLNPERIDLLNHFYRTMPLALYMGQKSEFVEYVAFSRALFDIDIDLNDILDSNNPLAYMPVPRERKGVLSGRIQNLILRPDTSHTKSEEFFLQAYERAVEENKDIAQNRLKLHFSAWRMGELAGGYLYSDPKAPSECYFSSPSFLWGDITNGESSVGWHRRRGAYNVVLNICDISAYFFIQGTVNKIRSLVRGHQHSFRQHMSSRRVIATTLPPGSSLEGFRDRVPEGLGLLLTTAAKVGRWKKQAVRYNIATHKISVDDHPIGMYREVFYPATVE